MERGEFRGTIGRYHWESEPYWPPEPSAPAGAPNVLIVLLDDVGFAQLGCFGSDIATPTFDRLAAGACATPTSTRRRCAAPPGRACSPGRNHHTCGMGRIIELASGFPGYDARIPRSCGLLPAMLTPHGYAAYAVGKWHLTPEEEPTSAPAATAGRWAGASSGSTGSSAARPTSSCRRWCTTTTSSSPPGTLRGRLPPHRGPRGPGHRVPRGPAPRRRRQAVAALPRHGGLPLAPPGARRLDRPLPRPVRRRLGPLARGRRCGARSPAGLLPAHTELSPRPDWVPAWDVAARRRSGGSTPATWRPSPASCPTPTPRSAAWSAGSSEQGELDRTLVLVLSDNGASSEGGPVGSLNDAPGLERAVHHRRGGRRAPRRDRRPPHPQQLPVGLDRRRQHPVPALEARDARGRRGRSAHRPLARRASAPGARCAPSTCTPSTSCRRSSRWPGSSRRRRSAASSSSRSRGPASPTRSHDAAAPERHTTQYYEMFGCRAIYHEGWKAVVYHPIQADEPGLDRAAWELYDLRADPSECDDLAAEHPDRLQALVERWWVEAARHQVLPLDNRPFSELVFGRPPAVPERRRYVYRPDRAPVPESVAVNVKNRRHSITAYVEVEGPGPVEGVLAVQGSVLGGWSFHLLGDGRLCYVHNLAGWREYRIEGPVGERLGPGAHTLSFRFTPARTAPPTAAFCWSTARRSPPATIERVTWSRFSITGAGLTVGWARDFSPADRDYRARSASPAGSTVSRSTSTARASSTPTRRRPTCSGPSEPADRGKDTSVDGAVGRSSRFRSSRRKPRARVTFGQRPEPVARTSGVRDILMPASTHGARPGSRARATLLRQGLEPLGRHGR